MTPSEQQQSPKDSQQNGTTSGNQSIGGTSEKLTNTKKKRPKGLPSVKPLSSMTAVNFAGHVESDSIDLSELPNYGEACMAPDGSGRLLKLDPERVVFVGDKTPTKASFGSVYRLHLPRNPITQS